MTTKELEALAVKVCAATRPCADEGCEEQPKPHDHYVLGERARKPCGGRGTSISEHYHGDPYSAGGYQPDCPRWLPAILLLPEPCSCKPEHGCAECVIRGLDDLPDTHEKCSVCGGSGVVQCVNVGLSIELLEEAGWAIGYCTEYLDEPTMSPCWSIGHRYIEFYAPTLLEAAGKALGVEVANANQS